MTFDVPAVGDEASVPVVAMEPTFEVDLPLRDESGQPITNTIARFAPVIDGTWVSRALRYLPVDEFGNVRIALESHAQRDATGHSYVFVLSRHHSLGDGRAGPVRVVPGCVRTLQEVDHPASVLEE